MTGSEPTRSFGARLGTAVGKLALALINATLMLFVAACVLGLVLIDKTRTIAAEVASDMTQAAISSTGLDPAATLAELEVVSAEMKDLRIAIKERRTGLDDKTAALAARLNTIEATINGLGEKKEAIVDTAIETASLVASDTLSKLLNCKVPDPGSQPEPAPAPQS